MAVYFRLVDKTTGEPEKFSVVDEKLCAFLGVPVDSRKYYDQWYDSIGFSLALGNSWEEIEEQWPEKKRVIDWIKENYNVVNGVTRKEF